MYDWHDSSGVDQGDFDPDWDPINIDSATDGSHGTTQVYPVGPSIWPYVGGPLRSFITYTPDPGFIGTDTFQYTISDPGGKTDTATVSLTVTPPPIVSVGWFGTIGSPLETNPNPGGGLRIWPDKNTLGNTDRSFVWVEATLTKAIAGVPIYMQVLDVDDPSANTAPVDDESNNRDNRGSSLSNPSTPYPIQVINSDVNGHVQFLFQVSMQPGDNFRIVASIDPIASGQYTGIQNDGTLAGVRNNSKGGARVPTGYGASNVMVSDMLTVWRRLNVEMDAMGTVGTNYVSGILTAPTLGINPLASSVLVATDQDLAASDAGRFNQGSLVDSAGNRFSVVSHTTGSEISLVVTVPAGAAPPVSGNFTLLDDDTLQTGQRVGYPDTSTLVTALAAAYVLPMINDVGTSNYNVPFDANVEYAEFFTLVSSQWESRSLNADNFWVAYLLGAFQGPASKDLDPDSEMGLLGETGLGVPGQNGGSLIYKETIVDILSGTGIPVSLKEADTVVHEIGHAVGDRSSEPVTNYDQPPFQPSTYTPEYLDAIRSSVKPRS